MPRRFTEIVVLSLSLSASTPRPMPAQPLANALRSAVAIPSTARSTLEEDSRWTDSRTTTLDQKEHCTSTDRLRAAGRGAVVVGVGGTAAFEVALRILAGTWPELRSMAEVSGVLALLGATMGIAHPGCEDDERAGLPVPRRRPPGSPTSSVSAAGPAFGGTCPSSRDTPGTLTAGALRRQEKSGRLLA